MSSWTKLLKGHPTTGEQLPRFGTAGLANICNATHTLATRNFSAGHIDNADELSGETVEVGAVARQVVDGQPLARALLEGGLGAIEVTLRT